jgi:hypothetical protein
VGLLAELIPLGEAIGLVSLGCYVLALIATLLLPETRGLKLSPTGLAEDALSPVPGVAAAPQV